VARQPWRPRTSRNAATSFVHVLRVLGDLPLSSIRPSDVQAFVAGLDLAPSTVRLISQQLRTVLRSAVRDGLIVRDPSAGVKLPRPVRGAVVPPDDAAVEMIYAAARSEFRVAVVLGAAAGLRQGEAAGLTVDRVDWLRRTVRVDRQWAQVDGWSPPKTLASIRTVPVAASVLDELARHLEEQGTGVDGVLVHGPDGRPVSHGTWGKWMRAAVKGAGLSGVRFHDLRHHYASRLIAAGCGEGGPGGARA
jgi:integrase